MVERSDLENLIDELLEQAAKDIKNNRYEKAHGIHHAVSELTKLMNK